MPLSSKSQYFQWVRLTVVVFLISFFSACGGCHGCGGCSSPPTHWAYQSKAAPYKLLLPVQWVQADPKLYNDYADFSVARGPLHAIIIPQKLDLIEGAPAPTSKDIKSASLREMGNVLNDLVVEDEVETIVGENPATTVYSHGKIDGVDIFYNTTYIVKNGWAFQIICWGPLEHREALTQASIQLLNGWGKELETPETKKSN